MMNDLSLLEGVVDRLSWQYEVAMKYSQVYFLHFSQFPPSRVLSSGSRKQNFETSLIRMIQQKHKTGNHIASITYSKE